MVLKAEKSKVNVPTDLVPSESAFSHLQTVAFPLRPHMVKIERDLIYLSLLIRTQILMRGPRLMSSFKPHYLPKAPPPDSITLGVRASIEFEGNIKHLVHNKY